MQKIQPNKTPNVLAIIIAAFIYMISPWVLEQVQAPFFWLSYAVTPGIILLAYRFFSERRLSFGIGLAILWTLASTTPHYALFSFLIIFFVWLCTHVQFQFGEFKGLIQSLRQRHFSALVKYIKINWSVKKYLKDLKLWMLIVAVFIALNAYWIVMTAFLLVNGTITPGYIFTSDMLQMFSSNANLQHVLSGTDQWISWWSGQYSDFIKSLVATATIALPMILLIAFGLAKKGKGDLRLLCILIGIWIVGVFFSSADKNQVYIWLATGSPLSSAYGWLLRVPGKISYLLWPAYAVCAGLVVQSAYSFCSSKKKGVLRKKALVMTALVVLLISSTGYAVLKSEDYFNYYYAPVPVPSQYEKAFAYINDNLTDARIADLARYESGFQINFTYLINSNSSITITKRLGNNLDYSINNTNSLLNHNQSFESSYIWNPNRIAGYFVPRSISIPNFGYYHFTYSGTWRPAYERFQQSISYVVYWDYNGTITTVPHLENVSSTAVQWLPVYGANYVLYHDDILAYLPALDSSNVAKFAEYSPAFNLPGTLNQTKFAAYDLEVLKESRCELIKQWGDIYLLKVPESFGRLYTLNSYVKDVAPTIGDIENSGVKIENIKQIDATLWQLSVNASNGFTLIFTEGFDSYWEATVTGNNGTSVVPSQKAFESINRFPITNQTGELQITLQYRPQVWLYYGIAASVVLSIVVAIALIYYSLIRNRKTISNRFPQ